MLDATLTDPQVLILRRADAGEPGLVAAVRGAGRLPDLERLQAYGYVEVGGGEVMLTLLGHRVLYGVDREWSDTGRGGLE